jgi:aspartyl-tRNA synthetase
MTQKRVMVKPFPRIPYTTAMNLYGSDKPDLRFELHLQDLGFLKKMTGFTVFQTADTIKGIILQNAGSITRGNIDDLGVTALNAEAKGLAWIRRTKDGKFNGPIAKFLTDDVLQMLMKEYDMRADSLLLAVADRRDIVDKALNLVRLQLGDMLGLRDPNVVAFAWITDFPMYEWKAEEKRYDFMHNPFSMPQGGISALKTKRPLDILAYQYDIVANNLELSSGAIRNHEPETLIKAFEIAGYTREEVTTKFRHMIEAFSYGAPPHGGFAPGIDRLIMLLRDEPNIREIYAFPLSSDAKDMMMGAPSEISPQQLKDVGLKLDETLQKKFRKSDK